MRAKTIADPDGVRRRMAAYLAEHGPTPGDRLAEWLGLTPERFWPLVFCPWFDIGGRGWGLTRRGRAEGLTAAGTPSAA